MGLVSGGYDSKKRGSRESGNSGGSNGGKLRDIYALMFKVHHLLPDEVGRQTPRVLFEMLDTLNGETEAMPQTNYDSPYIRAVLG
ncbi:MAG: hypothetical protein HFE51_10430 [Clostridia bacterium]|nr:hypothetical protein [Eubacterium sp.]MCI9086811.1 hypothetical protein [Clostridia bacterium]